MVSSAFNGGGNSVIIFSCATNFYQNFVVPYIYFAAKHNPSCSFEFMLSDCEEFERKNQKALLWLKKNLKVEILIRSANELRFKPKMDNSIRFVAEPKTTSQYTYIGDIDIMIFDDVLQG